MDKHTIGTQNTTLPETETVKTESPTNGSSKAAELKHEAGKQAKIAGQKLAEEASRGIDSIKAEAKNRAEEGKDELCNQIRNVGEAFDRVADELRNEGQEQLASYTSGLGRVFDRAAHYVGDRDLGHMLRATGDAIQSNMAVTCTAAFFLGLASARFLKSTPPPAPLPRPDSYALERPALPAPRGV